MSEAMKAALGWYVGRAIVPVHEPTDEGCTCLAGPSCGSVTQVAA